MFIRRYILRVLAGLSVVTALACESGLDGVFTGRWLDTAGAYTATALTTTTGGVTTDQLAADASLTMTLAVNGTVAGRLFIPGGDEDGSDLDADMAGTWTLSGSTVDFTQSADTFVRDMTFVASGNRLTGDATFGGTTIHVVLTR